MLLIDMDIPVHGCSECPIVRETSDGLVCFITGDKANDNGTRPGWCPLHEIVIGKWKQLHGYATPGGTPLFVCPKCDGSDHLYGAEYPRRRVVCKKCGQINVYPWEKTYDEEE